MLLRRQSVEQIGTTICLWCTVCACSVEARAELGVEVESVVEYADEHV
jgi:hypothetical protein